MSLIRVETLMNVKLVRTIVIVFRNVKILMVDFNANVRQVISNKARFDAH